MLSILNIEIVLRVTISNFWIDIRALTLWI
jgi:hypothetical protein